MSAYVVDDETIHHILGFCRARAVESDSSSLTPLAQCGHDLRSAASQPAPALELACARLGTTIHLLNVGAVRARYDDADTGMVPPAYEHKHATGTTAIRAYKALRCWLYQCSEGDVPKSPLYKAMTAILDTLAHEITCAAPEYDACLWG